MDDAAGLRAEIDALRRRICDMERHADTAGEELLRLRDIVAAAQRDQQDLRLTRARLGRVSARGLFARILNR
jgi:hypothetical protein